MRFLLLYLLPIVILLAALYALGSRRDGDRAQEQDAESSNASVFLKILGVGGCVAIALLFVIEF
jgi:hypothetical protein